MKLDSLRKLYIHELKDLHSAESQILNTMPRMIEAVSDKGLKKALQTHQKQTERQVKRLEKIFGSLDARPGGHKCRGMEGLLREASDLLKADAEPEVLDAAIVAATQRVEHYEMAGYGVARTYAEKLGDYGAADLLQETLNEEANADQTLSRLAERRLNFEALST
ncbi:MAG: ferritin-like domain-containing protein [Gemmatimonadetes bacterium]|nr:ferritin-like domain-containing protein [Gemmatimonadota bacterium]